MTIQRQIRVLAIGGAVAAAITLPDRASAQGGKTPPAASPVANPFAPEPGVKRVPVSKAVFGDAGVIVNARDDGYIEIAAAGPRKTIFLQLRTLAARAWIDSTSRMIKARVKKADPAQTFRSVATEYGTGTTMALTRSVDAGKSEYALAFSENPQSQFTVPIEAEEADVFVAIVRKAAVTSTKLLEKSDPAAAAADSAAQADSVAKAAAAKKKKPAAKRPASPARKDSTKRDSSAKAPATKPAPGA